MAHKQKSEKRLEENFKALDATRAAFKDVPDEELEREVVKAVKWARAEIRKERSAKPQG